MNFIKATRNYEKWLGRHIRLVQADLTLKHDYMADSFFAFFRGTFYRWAQLWPEVCAPLAGPRRWWLWGICMSRILARGGTRRAGWSGASTISTKLSPWLDNRLIRLLVSVHILCPEGHLKIDAKAAAEIVLGSYRKGLQAGGKPFVLAEEQTPLREMARDRLRDPEKFGGIWRSSARSNRCRAARARHSSPPSRSPAARSRFARRVSGAGSLGHERYIAIAPHQGGRIAREVKSRAPSACVWAGQRGRKDYYRRLIEKGVRCPDPFPDVDG